MSAPVYIGQFRDTIDIEKAFVIDTLHFVNPETHDSSLFRIPKLVGPKKHLKNADQHEYNPEEHDSVSIFVDTSYKCQSKYLIRQLEQTDTNAYLAYPVTINNTGKDTIFFYDLPIVIEVKNSSGNWNRISSRRTPVDHIGDPLYYCAPGELIVTYIPVYSGAAPARFRVHLKFHKTDFYSQEYDGAINPSFIK